MQVVWQLLVDALAGRWGNVWCDGEVDVGEEEEDGHGESGVDRRCPVGEFTAGFGEVDVDETAGDEDVDD